MRCAYIILVRKLKNYFRDIYLKSGYFKQKVAIMNWGIKHEFEFFIWVNPRRLNCICRRFGTLCSIFIDGVSRKNNRDEIFGAFKIQRPGNHPK